MSKKRKRVISIFFFFAVLIFSSVFSKDNYLGKYFININVSLKFATFLGIGLCVSSAIYHCNEALLT